MTVLNLTVAYHEMNHLFSPWELVKLSKVNQKFLYKLKCPPPSHRMGSRVVKVSQPKCMGYR